MDTAILKGKCCFIDPRIDATDIFLNNNISWHFDYFCNKDDVESRKLDLMEWALRYAQPKGLYD